MIQTISSEQTAAPAVCPRCGLRGGRHETASECIDQLRDWIARLQFRKEARATKSAQTSSRGGRRDRHDARMVILDDERLCITEAARRLGISTSALHFRLVNRCGPDYQEPDVRGVGADHARQHSSPARKPNTAPHSGAADGCK